jgi:CBS domain-containing protein
MTPHPVILPASASLSEAAKAMATSDIGTVLVKNRTAFVGILTDRDIVVRAVSEGKDPNKVACEDVCSHEVAALAPDDTVEIAVKLMRQKAVRRLPVVEDSIAIGIVSIGDLAQRLDRSSALADISAAEPNN